MDINNIFSENEQFGMLFRENSMKDLIKNISHFSSEYAIALLKLMNSVNTDVIEMLKEDTPQELYDKFVINGFKIQERNDIND